MPWKTFWMESTGRERVGLRRYARDSNDANPQWTCESGYHDALVWTDEVVDCVVNERGRGVTHDSVTIAADDPRWPAKCEKCEYEFSGMDERQVWTELLFRRTDTGELRSLHSRFPAPGAPTAEAGAMWDAKWMPAQWRGEDGISLMVRCPRNDRDDTLSGSDWPVDMPSTNSGGRWVRTGDPRQANVTANPSISIGIEGKPGSYHGWLHGGVLSDPL